MDRLTGFDKFCLTLAIGCFLTACFLIATVDESFKNPPTAPVFSDFIVK